MWRKYSTLFKSNILASIEYRGALIVWLLVELVSFATGIFFWTAVYRGNNSVGSYNQNSMLLYMILVPLFGAFTSIYVSDKLPREIKDGVVSKDIVKPYSFAMSTLINHSCPKIIALFVRLPVYIGVLTIGTSILGFQLNFYNLLLAFIFVPFCFLLNFFLDYSISLFAFWFDDAWALGHLRFVLMMIFGGMAFPIDIVPIKIRWLWDILPFKFVYFFPAKIAGATTNISLVSLSTEIAQLLLWMLAFFILSKVLWKKGVNKYGAYGN